MSKRYLLKTVAALLLVALLVGCEDPEAAGPEARWDLYHAYYKDRDAAAEAQIEYVKELRNLQHERDRRHQGNIHLIAQDY